MGEEKTLQDLNEEYVKLVSEVNELKTRVETAEENKNNANIQLEKALEALVDSEEDYKMKKSVYENAKGVYSEEIVEKMKEAMIEAETNVASLKKTLELRKENLEKAENAFGIIQEDAKNKNDRMNLILVSFGANEDINKAIVNELDNDYGDKVEEKEQAQKAIDELKTKINDDSKIQENVEELGRLLEEKEKAILEYSKDNSDANLKKINELHAQIKKKRQTISRRMRTLGVKGGKIEATEIEAMVTNRDENGRMIIPVLDRQYVDLDKEIGSLLNEKSEIIKSMNISREMAKDPSKVSVEYQELVNEIEKLTKEINDAEKQKQESEAKLVNIPKERKQLEAELEGAEKNVDKEAIRVLEDEIKQIQAEKVEQVENPRKEEIKKEIEKLKAEKGGKLEENLDYQRAKAKLEKAQRDLKSEKENPIAFLLWKKNEVIIDNPDYVSIKEKLEKSQDELKDLEKVGENEELTKLKEKLDANKENKDQKQEELNEKNEEIQNIEDVLKSEYVGKETYENLEEDDVKEVFNTYRDAELALRKAMFELQKNPNKETLKELLQAKSEFEKETVAIQNILTLENGVKPKRQAIHNYLEGILKEESKDNEMDEAYNSKNMENKINILRATRKIGKKDSENLEEFEYSSYDLSDVLDKMLKGKSVKKEDIEKLYKTHKENLEAFKDYDEVTRLLDGRGTLEESDEKISFFRKIFSKRYPEPEVEYDFEKNTKPEAFKRYEEMKSDRSEFEKLVVQATNEYENTKKQYEDKRKEFISPENLEKIEQIKGEISELEKKLQKTPKQINETKLNKLKEEVAKAQSEVDRIKENANIDRTSEEIQQEIENLEVEYKEIPDEVDEPGKSADKKRRISEKEEKIKALKGGESDKIKIIKEKLADLLNIETSERAKLGKAEDALEKKQPILRDKQRRMGVLKLAKEKFGAIKNLIKIKDASKLSDRRSGNLAQDLVEATKKQRMEDEER